jgi:hypothetical protein
LILSDLHTVAPEALIPLAHNQPAGAGGDDLGEAGDVGDAQEGDLRADQQATVRILAPDPGREADLIRFVLPVLAGRLRIHCPPGPVGFA